MKIIDVLINDMLTVIDDSGHEYKHVRLIDGNEKIRVDDTCQIMTLAKSGIVKITGDDGINVKFELKKNADIDVYLMTVCSFLSNYLFRRS